MLVLSREENEEIVITATNGEIIRVLVHAIGRKSISLGVIAPKSVRVDRAEVHARRKQGG